MAQSKVILSTQTSAQWSGKYLDSMGRCLKNDLISGIFDLEIVRSEAFQAQNRLDNGLDFVWPVVAQNYGQWSNFSWFGDHFCLTRSDQR